MRHASAPTAPRWGAVATFVAVLGTGSLAGSCATEEPGISPPRDEFYFPTGMALDGKHQRLYVVNSNADLMYNGGTLMALDLRLLPEDLSQMAARVGEQGLSCQPARADATSWECPESQFINPDATLRIGDFPSAVAVTSDGKRIFIPVRGQDYLLWAEATELPGDQLDLRCNDATADGCGGAGDSNCTVWDCDVAHKVDYSDELKRSMPSDPFGILLNELTAVHVDAEGRRLTAHDGVSAASVTCQEAEPVCDGADDRSCCIPAAGFDHIYLTHLAGGEVSFLTSEPGGVVLRDVASGFFTAQDNEQGGFGLAARTPGDPETSVYVSSRVDGVLASFLIRDNLRIIDQSRVLMGAIYPGNDNRDLAFAPGGDRLFVVGRGPSSLAALDMTLEAGLSKAEPLWVEEVCSEPSLISLAQNPLRPADPQALLAYVVCFATAQIFVVDTVSGTVVDEIATGKGPNTLVIDESKHRALVANFLENTIGVIDLDPKHSTYHRMVVRIGLERDLVRSN